MPRSRLQRSGSGRFDDQLCVHLRRLPVGDRYRSRSDGRIEIGTAVIGGMLTATILAVFYIPLFYVLVRRGVRDGFRIIGEHIRSRREFQA